MKRNGGSNESEKRCCAFLKSTAPFDKKHSTFLERAAKKIEN
jgi:hypothetical protein